MLPLRSILRSWLHPSHIDQGRTALNLTVLVTGDQRAIDSDPLTYISVEVHDLALQGVVGARRFVGDGMGAVLRGWRGWTRSSTLCSRVAGASRSSPNKSFRQYGARPDVKPARMLNHSGSECAYEKIAE